MNTAPERVDFLAVSALGVLPAATDMPFSEREMQTLLRYYLPGDEMVGGADLIDVDVFVGPPFSAWSLDGIASGGMAALVSMSTVSTPFSGWSAGPPHS